ncbi:unnamed protein product [Lactuca saligna]|uniref:Uncharacterized protein n=1 Tax=Lactuca saligna TaxID=75948 RepID=A0AA35ZEP8_LACSI|nr:unnamed protein product [Lactuca saligna]
MEELKSEMSKEINNTLFSTKLEAKAKSDSKVFDKLEEFLVSLMESLSKLDFLNNLHSLQIRFSNIISSLELNLKAELAPLRQVVNLMPTNVPPVKQVVQGRDNGVSSSKYSDQGKVVGKVIPTQLSTSLPVSLTTTSTTTTSRPITKGIIIGESVGGSKSSLKPLSSKEDKGDKGKGIKKI